MSLQLPEPSPNPSRSSRQLKPTTGMKPLLSLTADHDCLKTPTISDMLKVIITTNIASIFR